MVYSFFEVGASKDTPDLPLLGRFRNYRNKDTLLVPENNFYPAN
jgi:hypothetical protein